MRNMKSYRSIITKIAFVSAVFAFVSCGSKSAINGTFSDLKSSDVLFRTLDNKVLDTVKVDAAGKFAFKAEVKDGDPEFVYLYKGDRRLASFILRKGDRINVQLDTMGNVELSGSEESLKLAEVEKDYAKASASMQALSNQYAEASEGEARAIAQKMSAEFIRYYRSRVKYLLENSTSLSSIPVVYQKLGELYLFGQETDAMHINALCESLEQVYPDSRYVKSLRNVADNRTNIMEIAARIRVADEIPYVDIELPGVDGKNRKLSDVDARMVMIHFWTASTNEHKMFNQDVLLPVYREFKDKGLEIYAICLDADKANWARTVKNQGLDWVNVCDVRGAASPYVGSYNVPTLPTSYFIVDGQLVSDNLSGGKSLRELIGKYLR